MGTTYISMSATNYVAHAVIGFVVGAVAGATAAYIASKNRKTNYLDELALQTISKDKAII